MDHNLTKFIPLIEANIMGKFTDIPSQINGMEVLELSPGIKVINSNLQTDMFNIVYCTGGVTDQEVEVAIKYFTTRKLPFAWWVGFESEQPNLPQMLQRHGLKPTEDELIMYASLENKDFQDGIIKFTQLINSNSSLSIKAVENQQTLQDFIHVLNILLPHEKDAISNFYKKAAALILDKDSPRKLNVGYIDNEPVATNAIYLLNGMAGIYDIIALPKTKVNGIGIGIGGIMTLQAIKVAADMKAVHCIGTATNRAKYLYTRLGAQAVKPMWVYNL